MWDEYGVIPDVLVSVPLYYRIFSLIFLSLSLGHFRGQTSMS
jgi:hypothetical protein